MTDVLVCIKRVPGSSGQLLLSADEQSVDARHVGWTVSPHEDCAVELATQVASATGGTATVLTVGSADAVEQLRDALAVGCAAAVLVEAVLAWSTEVGVDTVRLLVVEGNEGARRVYERQGFHLTGRSEVRARDGLVEVELERALDREPAC